MGWQGRRLRSGGSTRRPRKRQALLVIGENEGWFNNREYIGLGHPRAVSSLAAPRALMAARLPIGRRCPRPGLRSPGNPSRQHRQLDLLPPGGLGSRWAALLAPHP